MAFSFRCAAITHIGNERKNHEDNFYIGEGQYLSAEEQRSMSQLACRSVQRFTEDRGTVNRIYAVSDGMGGHKDGEIASRIVVEAIDSFSRRNRAKASVKQREKYALIQRFQEMVAQTNAEILEQSGGFDPAGMGATLSGVLFFAKEAVSFNIGDSSTFLYENGFLRKLTVDDNEAQALRETGAAPTGTNGKRLTKYFGVPESYGVLTARISMPVPLRPGQLYLLASDGLTDDLSMGELTETIRREYSDPERIAVQLTEKVLNRENGGHDNITVVAVKVL